MGLVLFGGDYHQIWWRYYILALCVPGLFFILFSLLFLHDSPKYLLSRGNEEEARKILNKMAKINNKTRIPETVTLELDLDLDTNTDTKNGSFRDAFAEVVKNMTILRSLVGVVMIGFLTNFTMSDLGYIATELVFLRGQTDADYCVGTKQNSYLLKYSDYFLLCSFMTISTLVQIVATIPANLINSDFKTASIACMSFSFCIAACLYTCPPIWVTLLIYCLIDTTSIFLELSYSIYLSRILPTNVRSVLYGTVFFLMSLPLTATPYLIQVLSKESVHYVTTVTLSFITFGLLGALLLPSISSHKNHIENWSQFVLRNPYLRLSVNQHWFRTISEKFHDSELIQNWFRRISEPTVKWFLNLSESEQIQRKNSVVRWIRKEFRMKNWISSESDKFSAKCDLN